MKPNPETGKEEPLMKELSRPLVRRYIVFNASQIENVPPAHPFTIDEKDRNDAMEAMLKTAKPPSTTTRRTQTTITAEKTRFTS